MKPPRFPAAALKEPPVHLLALGTQYRPGDAWQPFAGVAYDRSATLDEDRTASPPMGQAWRFSVGAQWPLSNRVSLNAAYTFLWAGDLEVVQSSSYRGTVAGAFEDSWFSFLTGGVVWRF